MLNSNTEQVNDPTRPVSTWSSKERTQLPLGHFLILSESPCMDCVRPKWQQLEPMVHRFKTKNQLSWAQEPLYHWMEHFFSWAEHMLFCHIICKSRVMLQDFYLQPFFSCWVFDKVNENPSLLAELQSVTSRAFLHFQPSVAFDINLGSWTT